MSDDKTSMGNKDRVCINVHEDADVHEWAEKLNVSSEQIREAVQAVGNQADQVELHLKGTRSTTNADTTERAEGSEASFQFAQDKVRDAAEYAIGYTKAEPVKAIVIAVATGFLLAGIVMAVTRPRD